jgi:hypothetical protein
MKQNMPDLKFDASIPTASEIQMQSQKGSNSAPKGKNQLKTWLNLICRHRVAQHQRITHAEAAAARRNLDAAFFK